MSMSCLVFMSQSGINVHARCHGYVYVHVLRAHVRVHVRVRVHLRVRVHVCVRVCVPIRTAWF